jgi:hypothetical protein
LSTREEFYGAMFRSEITPMSQEQTVSEMVERVLLRQARKLADRTGIPLGDALQTVAATEAGTQLRELGEGEHRHEKARTWQANLRFERADVGIRR